MNLGTPIDLWTITGCLGDECRYCDSIATHVVEDEKLCTWHAFEEMYPWEGPMPEPKPLTVERLTAIIAAWRIQDGQLPSTMYGVLKRTIDQADEEET